MSSVANHQPPEFAKHWANELGSSEKSLVQLQGGINNRVFRCGEAHNQWVIKGYSPLEPDQRDRMQAEVDFLRYSAEVAPNFTPKLIHSDPELRCVVLEYIEGRHFSEGVAPLPEEIEKAVTFFKRLNEKKILSEKAIKIDAADGFLSLSNQIKNIKSRLSCMNWDHLQHDHILPFKSLVKELQIEIELTEQSTNYQIEIGNVVDSIDQQERCVSPSDFGFHNAIITKNGVVFIDFEFAGWDDPAKAIVDFVLQPRIPIKCGVSPLLATIAPTKKKIVQQRCHFIMPILRLKWACIMIGGLQQDRLNLISKIYPEKKISSLISHRLSETHELVKSIKIHR